MRTLDGYRSPTGLIRIAQVDDLGDRSRLYRELAAGAYRRIARGVLVPESHWAALDPDARHRLLIAAVAERMPGDEVVAHLSAAALWRLPTLDPWPDRVQTLGPAIGGGRGTTERLRRTGAPDDQVVVIDGFPVTSLARTVVDISRTESLESALVVADAALRRSAHPVAGLPRTAPTRADLERELARVPRFHGERRAARVIALADGRAQLPGETLSRLTMMRLGVPEPVLQHRVFATSGRYYDLDFYWPEQNIGAEFDGKVKYLDPRYRTGRTAEQVVYDEKVREDELRLELDGFGRWDWTVARTPHLLAERLRLIGLRW
ncbi:hypothetical protein [Microcella sp.]|uniref:hypothetical protein n=1 Tax=Microcella sp. TaxID=1913979 RepID=UPI003F70893D